MTKLQKIVFFSMLLLVALLVYAEATKRQPISWFPSYSRVDKIPLGTYVLHDLLSEKLEDNFIEQHRPPYEVLADTTLEGTYFFVNNYLGFDTVELEELLTWTERGNTLFLSSNSFAVKLLDTLSLDMTTEYHINNLGTEPLLALVNENLKAKQPYHIERSLTIRPFMFADTLSQTVLGVTESYLDSLVNSEPKPNFIKTSFGKGTVYLHSQPEVFTNYFILEKDNVNYTEGVLAYINTDKPLYWDSHYKSGKPIQTSPLHILLNNKYLRWAYYMMLIGALLFVLFEGKRKQRKIAVVAPPSNKTFEYTRTIAGMYWDQKDYGAIANKQIALFLEFIRTRLRIPTETMNSRFMKTVAARSGNTEEDTKALFTFIQQIQALEQITPETLFKLHTKITTYKQKTDGKS
ncbi:DUF4350 domain-containing protein [Rasiella rasia]|uniref:DUF4350 domain-containing protein n=1 Tax=Rasiella rasia TaxID=2744027 RepID=A0A6G6GHU6_9FLAO|nr:DUF4350 domain-containing protein [Rasiella rasia]QIE58119.1 DUF4350 domain-containing protein [Rasiella rasia]